MEVSYPTTVVRHGKLHLLDIGQVTERPHLIILPHLYNSSPVGCLSCHFVCESAP